MASRVLGVDACRAGWVGVSLDDDDGVQGWFATTIGQLVDRANADASLSVIAIDIPIGLPTDGIRQADIQARALLGARSSSIFTTLVRAAYEATTFQAANQAQLTATTKGTTQQGWGLRHKVLEVDRWLAHHDPDDDTDDDTVVVECHPELSFTAMNGGTPVPVAKKTWAGHHRRRELLAAHGLAVPSDLGEAGQKAGMDDVLDATAAAWTARRVTMGEAVSIPDVPEPMGDRVAAIVY